MNRMLVVSIWRKSWFGCLRPPAAAARWPWSLDQLQQGLLHALARDVAGDGRVVGLALILSISSM